MKNTDLHTHSFCSDGELSPAELVRLAKKKGIRNLALTDHNSVTGISEAIEEGKKTGVNIIPAVEVVVKDWEILGYFIDFRDEGLKKSLKRASYYDNEKTKQMIDTLKNQGYDISYKIFIKEYPNSKDNHNKAHLICYFYKLLGYSREKTMEILNKVKIREPKMKNISAIAGIRLIRKYGGTPVLAHPWLNKKNFTEVNIKRFVRSGLKGIEIENGEEYNFGRTKEFVEKIKRIAEKYDLILTSGSDYHGKIMSELTGTHHLGKYNCDEKVVVKLESLRK